MKIDVMDRCWAVVDLGLHVSPTAKVTRRRDLGLKSHPKYFAPGYSRKSVNLRSKLSDSWRHEMTRKLFNAFDTKPSLLCLLIQKVSYITSC